LDPLLEKENQKLAKAGWKIYETMSLSRWLAHASVQAENNVSCSRRRGSSFERGRFLIRVNPNRQAVPVFLQWKPNDATLILGELRAEGNAADRATLTKRSTRPWPNHDPLSLFCLTREK